MGKTKLGRIFRDMVISGVRSGAEIIKTIPEKCKFCGSPRTMKVGVMR